VPSFAASVRAADAAGRTSITSMAKVRSRLIGVSIDRSIVRCIIGK